jgi:hypothetical protein
VIEVKKLKFIKWRGGSFKAAKKAVEEDIKRYREGKKLEDGDE